MTNFDCYNDTAIAYMFISLIKKDHTPYNNNKLTLEEYQNEYNIAKEFMGWHKNNYDCGGFSLYDFSRENLTEIFDKLDYNTDNTAELTQIWNDKIMNMSRFREWKK